MSKTTLFDSRIKKYAYREVTQLYGELGSSPAGLSPEQVEKQREKYGSNRFGSHRSDTMLRRLRRAFINPFNVILFVLGCISLVTDGFLASDFSKNATTALIIFSMILISGGILTMAAGFRVSKIKSVPLVDLMPALILVMPFSMAWSALMG